MGVVDDGQVRFGVTGETEDQVRRLIEEASQRWWPVAPELTSALGDPAGTTLIAAS